MTAKEKLTLDDMRQAEKIRTAFIEQEYQSPFQELRHRLEMMDEFNELRVEAHLRDWAERRYYLAKARDPNISEDFMTNEIDEIKAKLIDVCLAFDVPVERALQGLLP